MKRSNFLCLLMALIVAITAVGCSEEPSVSTPTNTQKPLELTQMELPQKGEDVAVLHTSLGDIYIRLFPEYAPKAVENFKGLINKGYYNGILFHCVIEDYIIQTGDPNGDGTGGESIWANGFEDEFSEQLLNLNYSVAMYHDEQQVNGSQFFVNCVLNSQFNRSKYQYDIMYKDYEDLYYEYMDQDTEGFATQYLTVDSFIQAQGGIAPDSRKVPEEVWQMYEKYGGNIHLDGAWREFGGYTVFGQIYAGKDVVDAIAAVETNEETNQPIEDIVINSAEIVQFQG